MIEGLSCPYLLLALVVLLVVGHWVLSPFTEAVQAVQAPRRFLLSDFIWLVVLLQISFAAARWALPVMGLFVFIMIASGAATVAVWAGAVSALSRAGISEARRRGAFLVVVLPGLLLLMGLIGLGGIVVVMVMIEPPQRMDVARRVLTVVGFLVAVPGLAWCLRWLTRWVAAGAARPGRAGRDREAK